jgi:hypothetical protein
MNYRELAKFLSGLITGDFLFGVWLLTAGDLPINFLGMRISPEFTFWWLAIDIILFILLVRYAWFGKSAKKKK